MSEEDKLPSNINEWDENAWEKRMEKVNNASNMLGTFLLKGYTMLGDHCPVCASPLMSLRSGEPKCVVCAEAKDNSKAADDLKKAQAEAQAPRNNSNIHINTNNKQSRTNDRLIRSNGLMSSKFKKSNILAQSPSTQTQGQFGKNDKLSSNLHATTTPLSGHNGASGYEQDLESKIGGGNHGNVSNNKKRHSHSHGGNNNTNSHYYDRYSSNYYAQYPNYGHVRHSPHPHAHHPYHGHHPHAVSPAPRMYGYDRRGDNCSYEMARHGEWINHSLDASIVNILRKMDGLNEKLAMNEECDNNSIDNTINDIKELQACVEFLDFATKVQDRVNACPSQATMGYEL